MKMVLGRLQDADQSGCEVVEEGLQDSEWNTFSRKDSTMGSGAGQGEELLEQQQDSLHTRGQAQQ